jgi:hypothetical protein
MNYKGYKKLKKDLEAKNPQQPLWKCEICGAEVKDKGKGFRVFLEHNAWTRFKGDAYAVKKIQQIRICSKCLKTKNYSTIKL